MDDSVLEIPSKVNLNILRESADAACRTLELAEKHDLPFDDALNVNLPPPTNDALNASATSTPLSGRTPAVKTTASLLEIYNLLREFGGSLNATAEEVRNTVINKLLLETDNQDPNIRLKALKMLGEVPEIGLFGTTKTPPAAEKPDSEVAAKLKARLHELKQGVEGVYESTSRATDAPADEPVKE